ncbi:MAG: hypothetical protein WCS83_00045 [Endomicrobiia bacterium]
MFQIKKIKKIISIFVVNCFLLSFVYGQVVSSVIANITTTQQYKQIFNDFMLPYSYGQITSSHFTSSDRLVINIQDLHCHPIVQKNISNIIELFNKEHEISNIYLEGAYGKVSTKWITQSIGSSSKNNVIEKMIETGRLTGAEYYSVLSGKTEIIKGLEQREAYLDNLKRFGKILENQEKINKILEEIKKSTLMLKNKYYDRKQLKIEQLSNDYINGKITPEKYFALLSKHVDKLGIDIHKYNNTYSYIMLLSQQKKLSYKKITKELQTLVLLLKERIPYSAYKMLMDSTENFSKIDKLYVYLIRITREYNLDLQTNFKELNKYLQYVEFSQKINPIQLIKEEHKLINEINTRFSETKVQREIVFLTNFEKYLEDYTTSKITSEDYEYYKNNIDKYRELWNKYVDNRVLSLLEQYLLEADKFYVINTERNKYFINNIFDGIETSNMKSKKEINIIDNIKNVKRVDVVITGGFHTDSVSKILEEKNVSYIVITPNVTGGIKYAQKTYYQIAKEQSNISFQTLANLIASLSPIDQIKILQKLEPNINLKERYSLSEINAAKIKGILDDKQINNISNLIINIKKAKLLESDDLGNINEQIVSLIRNNLDNEPNLLEKINKNLLEYINIDTLQQSLTDAKKLKHLVTKAIYKQNIANNDKVFKQTLLLYNSIAEDVRQIIDDLISIIKVQEKHNFVVSSLSQEEDTKNIIHTLPILQLKSTVQKLEEMGIDRYSFKGIVLGVIFETFLLWKSNFLNQHKNKSKMMKYALLIIKTFTILSAIFGLTCISPLLLSGVGLYSISGITGTAIVTLLTAITGEWIIHIAYNFLKVFINEEQDNNISLTLQIADNTIAEEDVNNVNYQILDDIKIEDASTNIENQILLKSEYLNNRDSIGIFLKIKDDYYYVEIHREGDLKLMSKNNDLFFNKMDQVFKGMYINNFIKVQKQYDEENQKWKVIITKGPLYFDDIKITLINKNKYFEQPLPKSEKLKILLSNEYKRGLDALGIMLDKPTTYSIIFLGALFGDDKKNTKEIIQQIDLTDKTVILYPIGVGADFNSLTNHQLYSLFTDNKNAFFIFMHDFIDNFLNIIASDMEQKERAYLSIDLYHFLYESLKNALVHGNNGDPNKPIYIVTKYDTNTKEYSIAVYNESFGQTSEQVLAIAVATGISGMHKGIENMEYSIEKLPLTFFAGQTKNNMYLTYLTNSKKFDEQYKIIKLGGSSVKEDLNIDGNIDLKLEQNVKVININTSEQEDLALYNQAKTLKTKKTIKKLEKMQIDKYSFKGTVLGVVFETFSLWKKDFIKQHSTQSKSMKVAINVIKLFTIASGFFGGTVVAPVLLPVLGVSSIPGFFATAIITVMMAITGEWIVHIIYNKYILNDKLKALDIPDIFWESNFAEYDDIIGIFLKIEDESFFLDIKKDGDVHLVSRNTESISDRLDQKIKGMNINDIIDIEKKNDKYHNKWKILVRAKQSYNDKIKISFVNKKNPLIKYTVPSIDNLKAFLQKEQSEKLEKLKIDIQQQSTFSILLFDDLLKVNSTFKSLKMKDPDIFNKPLIIYPIGVGCDISKLTDEELFIIYYKNYAMFSVISNFFISNFCELNNINNRYKEEPAKMLRFIFKSLRDAFIYGNNGDSNKPIYMTSGFDNQTNEYFISIFNSLNGKTTTRKLKLAASTQLVGYDQSDIYSDLTTHKIYFPKGETFEGLYATSITNSKDINSKLEENLKVIDTIENLNLSYQENSEISQTFQTVKTIHKLEKMRIDKYSFKGIFLGVIIETFSFWTKDFIEGHDIYTDKMKNSIKGIKIFTITFAASITLITSVFIPILMPLLIPLSVLFAEWSLHIIYNLKQIKIRNLNKFILVSINPISKIKNKAVNIISLNEIQKPNSETKFNISRKLLLVNNRLIANKLREEGFNVVSIKIVENKKDLKECVKISGVTTQYNNSVVRVYWNSKTKEIVFYSKKGLIGVDIENLKQSLNKAFSDGIKNDIFNGIEQIIITNKLTSYDVINEMKNEYTYSVTMPLKEVVLNLSKKENLDNLSNICEQEYKVNNIKIFVVNNEQSQKYAAEITLLQGQGFKFILETTNAANNIILNGSRIDADNITDINIAHGLLEKLQEFINNKGVDTRIAIKFNEDILDKFVKRNIDIWNTYGILPIVDKQSKYINFGKVDIFIDENITQQEIKSIYNDDNVIAITIDDGSVLLNDLINQIDENSTLKQQYAKGYNACLNSKFDYTTTNVKMLFSLISNDLINNENLAEILKNISTTQLSVDSKSYLEFLLSKGKYAEALGFIRGISMNSIRKEIINILADKNINIDLEKMEKESNGKYQKALLILAIQLIISGENINDLLNDEFIDSDTITVKDYLDSIISKVNGNIGKILRENEYFITKVNNTLEAISDFKEFNVLLLDNFRRVEITDEVKVSVLTIKNILSAA